MTNRIPVNLSALNMRVLSADARDLAPDIFDDKGRLRIMPAAYYARTTQDDRSLTCARHGLYCLPTVELVAWLKARIGSRSALEIGSGNGVLAEAVGIRATDNRMQEWPLVRLYYQSLNQATVRYGDNVETIDAKAAVTKYSPDVVLAAWVTHKYDPNRPKSRGNEFGVVEEDILAQCEEYIFIGNLSSHHDKSIWDLPHSIISYDWLYSRNGQNDFIATVPGKKVR